MAFTINQLFRDKISKITNTLIPLNFRGDAKNIRMARDQIIQLINHFGQQSSVAQNLNRVITTAEKIGNSSDLVIYVLVDHEANGGTGSIIGYLKVGRKKLYLHDPAGNSKVVEPICVLDFFVVTDRQRYGYGKQLFDYMLNDLGLEAIKMPIDGPSPKLVAFLKKHYGITNLIHHSNNFSIDSSFFGQSSEKVRETSIAQNSSFGSGRFSAPYRGSSMASIIHGDANYVNAGDTNGRNSSASAGAAKPPVEVNNMERPSTLKIEGSNGAPEQPQAIPKQPQAIPEQLRAIPEPSRSAELRLEQPEELNEQPDAGAHRDRQVTDKGYFDLKYYHSTLW